MKGDHSGGFFTGPKFYFSDAERLCLAPVDEAVCGIVALAGKFQGYGEAAGIHQVKHEDGRAWWQAAIDSKAELYAVKMGVRCIARDQR